MMMKTGKLSFEKARNICIVKYLAQLGHFPSRTTEKEAWFLSPLRSETTASFKVSKVLNKWYDFGIGKGGSLIDLVCLIQNCEVKEALAFLEKDTITLSYSTPKKLQSKKTKIQITKVELLDHPALLHYLKSRKIPLNIARVYCSQVWYDWRNKPYYAIGLKNHLGGWELRNKYFKNSSSPKTYSLLERDTKQLIILEGMFDFLSLATIDEELVRNSDCMILNSLAFVDRIKPLIPEYDRVLLYLDNDHAGKKAAAKLASLYEHITDCSYAYKDHVDLNEKLIKFEL